jgi:tyrosyl-tRNA synthetase
MREVAPKLDEDFALKIGEARITPIAMHHHLLLGLAKPVLGEVSKMKDEIVEENKMSKSKPDSCIFGDDSELEIAKKIKKAYCPMPNLETQTMEEIILEQKLNPILDWINYMIFPANGEFVITTREQKTIVYSSYLELEKDYFVGQIHPSDLKTSLTTTLVKLLEKPRTWAQNNPQAIEFITKLRK